MTLQLTLAIAGAIFTQQPPSPQAPDTEQPAADQAKSPIKPPHPLITEILFAVPSGDAGDANGDGARSATGDEFVELYNPHDKPIELRGYTITDKSGGKPGSLKFVFPACKLQPGQCAVVFNGFECTWAGPIGDSTSAPKEGHKKFSGARVFSMKMTNNRNAFSNSGDCVCLTAPDGAVIHLVKWGKIEGKLPAAKLVEDAPTTDRGSVQRDSVGGKFTAHPAITGAGSSVRYSPGLFGKSAEAADEPGETKKDAEPPKPAPEQNDKKDK